MFFRVLMTAQLVSTLAFAADELPKELLLQCEGNLNAVMDVPKPESRSSTFRLNLRLKDSSVLNAQTGVVEGEECGQDKGEIRCKTTKLYPFPNSIVQA